MAWPASIIAVASTGVLALACRMVRKVSVRNTAMGSLRPASTSRVARRRPRRRMPRTFSRKNTAAASVEATMEPTISPSAQPTPMNHFAARPAMRAVITTPALERVAAGVSTSRKSLRSVRNPPSNRMMARASEPTV